MKLFIWEYLEEVSCNYHTEGGLVVVEDDLKSAVELAEKNEYVTIGDIEPDHVYDVGIAEAKVLIFQDAGCC